jgi:diacylglycerol O-acyltransferase / wax synthase
VKRLSGLDASFLYLETPAAPMHVGSLMIFDPSTADTGDGGWTFERTRAMYAERLHFAPPFRRRLVEVPFGIHHPIWVEDPAFDLDQHLFHIGCPAPGGPDELATLAAQLMARPLDRTRALWEAWVIDGLASGSVKGAIAVMTKVHHACLDGVSGNNMTIAFLDTEPDAAPVTPAPWEPDDVPSDVEMLAFALDSMRRQPVRVLKSTRRALESAVAARRHGQAADDGGVAAPPSLFSAPHTSWTKSLSPQRDYAFFKLPLDEVKAVKNAAAERFHGTRRITLNDVVMATCAGALRRHLDAQGEAVSGPLVAMIPMSVVSAGERTGQDNQVSMMLSTLATDVDDPVERLRVISEGMVAARGQQEAVGATTLMEWTEYAAPVVAANAMRVYARIRAADRHKPLFNLTISNVPGPAFPLYSAGMKMTGYHPMGPINHGAALNITVLSYLGALDVGIVTDPTHIAAAPLAREMTAALADLAASLAPTPAARKAAPRKRKAG